MTMNLISIGEVLWDVVRPQRVNTGRAGGPVGDVEHLGGAPLNFAANVARLGHTSCMVGAVGNDERGRHALERISSLGLTTEYIVRAPHHATGHVTVELDRTGQPSFTIHRPAAYDEISLPNALLQRLTALQPKWVYFGTLAQTSHAVRATTEKILAAVPAAKRFYDVNLRPACYERDVVLALLASATVIKLNDAEVPVVEALIDCEHHASIEAFCRELARRFGTHAVCVTRGGAGCGLLLDGLYIESPAYAVQIVDCIGAGDAFSAGLVHALASGWDARRAADFANRLGGLVASRPGAIPDWTMAELDAFG